MNSRTGHSDCGSSSMLESQLDNAGLTAHTVSTEMDRAMCVVLNVVGKGLWLNENRSLPGAMWLDTH